MGRTKSKKVLDSEQPVVQDSRITVKVKNNALLKSMQDKTPSEVISMTLFLKGWSKAKFSRMLGATNNYCIMLCNNKSTPDTKACLKIAQVLDMDPYLLNRICADYRMTKLIKQKI